MAEIANNHANFSISATPIDQNKGSTWQRRIMISAALIFCAIGIAFRAGFGSPSERRATPPLKSVPMVVVNNGLPLREKVLRNTNSSGGKDFLSSSGDFTTSNKSSSVPSVGSSTPPTMVRSNINSSDTLSKSAKKDNKMQKLFESKDKIVLGSAKTLLQDMLSLIRHRYELDGAGAMFFHTANNIGSHTWDVIKYKFARKIVDSQIKQKTQPQQFLMVFGGSSVTAGHDNHYNQSYPFVVERRLQPVLRALGITLTVTNIAQGANPCLPYSLCYETMGGLDADVIGWEQSYNCGGDEMISEYMGRIAAFSANRAIVYYSASGAWNPDKCPSSNSTPPYAYEYWRPEMAGLTPWTPSHTDILSEKNTLDEWNKAHESSDRFTKWKNKGDSANKNLAAHGFNVWEANPKCVVPDTKGRSKVVVVLFIWIVTFCCGVSSVFSSPFFSPCLIHL